MKDKNKQNASKRRAKLLVTKFIRELKIGPCEICGGIFKPWVMQFDHIDPKQKKYNVCNSPTITSAKREIEKCRLLCANCHADVTHRDWKRYRQQEVESVLRTNQLTFL